MRTRVLALALCALLALAGCNGFLTGPTTPESTADDYPPGLVMNGVSDPGALAAAHENSISDGTYAFSMTRTVSQNGSVRGVANVTARIGRGNRTFAVSRATGAFYPNSPSRTATWTNGSVTAYRTVADGDVRYWYAELDASPGWPRQFYESFRFDVNRTADGFTLTSTGVREHATFGVALTDVSNASLVVHLSPRGVVRSYRLELDGTAVYSNRTGTYHVVKTANVTRTGGVTAERPEWASTARNESNTSARSADVSGVSVRVD